MWRGGQGRLGSHPCSSTWKLYALEQATGPHQNYSFLNSKIRHRTSATTPRFLACLCEYKWDNKDRIHGAVNWRPNEKVTTEAFFKLLSDIYMLTFTMDRIKFFKYLSVS